MATVKSDIIDGGRGSKDYLGWKNIDRIIIVDGLTSTDAWATKIDASITAASLTIGTSTHPTATNCKLLSIDVSAISNTSVKLNCVYSRETLRLTDFEDGSIDVGASVTSEETNQDINGDDMFLSYLYPADYKTESLRNITDEQGHIATKLIPDMVWSIQRINDYSPQTEAMTYVGRVNSESWNSGAAETWLCISIRGRSVDGGDTYNTTYEFQYKPKTWKHTGLYIKDDGKPPKITDSNSLKTWTLYSTINFNDLGLV